MNARTVTGTVSPVLYTVPQAAEALSIGTDRVYELAASGSLRSVRIGRSVRIPVGECHAWVARQLEAQR